MIAEREIQADEKDQLIAALQQQLARKDEQIQQLRSYRNAVEKIASNKGMTYADRVLWIVTLNNHSQEVLELKPFQPNISHLIQESGVSSDSATKFFASMTEAKAIKYTNKSQQDEDHNFTSVSTVIPLTNHCQANTRAAALRIKQRSESTRRRIARKLIIQPCPECGSESLEHAYSAIIPICKSCNHVSMEEQQTVLSKNLRIVEEETTSPTPGHEFSEVEDFEWEEVPDPDAASSTEDQAPPPAGHEFSDQSDDNPPSHEFSEDQTTYPTEDTGTPPGSSSNPDQKTSTATDNPPSHEFSEGMTVATPNGIGTIRIISYINNRYWCRVRFDEIQENGTYYLPYELSQLQPVEGRN